MVWYKQHEKFSFSIVDAVQVLTGSDRPRKYWNNLKSKLTSEGSELSDKIGQLKIRSLKDGKYYKADVDNPELAINRGLALYKRKGYPDE